MEEKMSELKSVENSSEILEVESNNAKNHEPTNENVEIKTKTLRKKFAKLSVEIKEWSLLTKFDCYSKIFQAKSFLLQFLWLSLFLIFTAFTAFFVSKNILDYLEHETISKIEIINEKPTEFPTVTICQCQSVY